MKFSRLLTLSVFLFISIVPLVNGQQSTTATLIGMVIDQNGAVIPGATVTATQTSTGFRRTASSNDVGSYILTNLPTGEYEVKV
ncbi:MAG: carboxypeptidase-like regulatory domain-containing protein, partial [Pyrinomonadaceae bacterium]